jgi:hypothetical protein
MDTLTSADVEMFRPLRIEPELLAREAEKSTLALWDFADRTGRQLLRIALGGREGPLPLFAEGGE